MVLEKNETKEVEEAKIKVYAPSKLSEEKTS